MTVTTDIDLSKETITITKVIRLTSMGGWLPNKIWQTKGVSLSGNHCMVVQIPNATGAAIISRPLRYTGKPDAPLAVWLTPPPPPPSL